MHNQINNKILVTLCPRADQELCLGYQELCLGSQTWPNLKKNTHTLFSSLCWHSVNLFTQIRVLKGWKFAHLYYANVLIK